MCEQSDLIASLVMFYIRLVNFEGWGFCGWSLFSKGFPFVPFSGEFSRMGMGVFSSFSNFILEEMINLGSFMSLRGCVGGCWIFILGFV